MLDKLTPRDDGSDGRSRLPERASVDSTGLAVTLAFLVATAFVAQTAVVGTVTENAESDGALERVSVEAQSASQLSVTPVVGQSVNTENLQFVVKFPDNKSAEGFALGDVDGASEESETKTKEVTVTKQVKKNVTEKKPKYKWERSVEKEDAVYEWSRTKTGTKDVYRWTKTTTRTIVIGGFYGTRTITKTTTQATRSAEQPGPQWDKGAKVGTKQTEETETKESTTRPDGAGWEKGEKVDTETSTEIETATGFSEPEGDGWEKVNQVGHKKVTKTKVVEVEKTVTKTVHEFEDGDDVEVGPPDHAAVDDTDEGGLPGPLETLFGNKQAAESTGNAPGASSTSLDGIGGTLTQTPDSWNNGESVVFQLGAPVLEPGDVVQVQVVDKETGDVIINHRARLTSIPGVSVDDSPQIKTATATPTATSTPTSTPTATAATKSPPQVGGLEIVTTQGGVMEEDATSNPISEAEDTLKLTATVNPGSAVPGDTVEVTFNFGDGDSETLTATVQQDGTLPDITTTHDFADITEVTTRTITVKASNDDGTSEKTTEKVQFTPRNPDANNVEVYGVALDAPDKLERPDLRSITVSSTPKKTTPPKVLVTFGDGTKKLFNPPDYGQWDKKVTKSWDSVGDYTVKAVGQGHPAQANMEPATETVSVVASTYQVYEYDERNREKKTDTKTAEDDPGPNWAFVEVTDRSEEKVDGSTFTQPVAMPDPSASDGYKYKSSNRRYDTDLKAYVQDWTKYEVVETSKWKKVWHETTRGDTQYALNKPKDSNVYGDTLEKKTYKCTNDDAPKQDAACSDQNGNKVA